MGDLTSTDILNAATGVLTAVFTGWGAYLVWRQQRERISLEWEESYSSGSPEIVIKCRVRNDTSQTLKAWHIAVEGPVTKVVSGPDKHSSWKMNETPINCQIDPKSTSSFSFKVTPEWDKLQQQSSRWHSRLKSWWAKTLWIASPGSARVHHGASLHFHIIIDSKSNRRFRNRITETMFISPATIERRIADIKSQNI